MIKTRRFLFSFLMFCVVGTPLFGVMAENLLPDTVNPNACNFENTYSIRMIPVYIDSVYDCPQGYYLPSDTEGCERCPENSYCPGGNYTFSADVAVGINPCPVGTFTRTGMWEAAQCGRILHVGNEELYLRTNKKTSPALFLDMNHDGVAEFYGNMTLVNVPMNSSTQRQMKIRYNDQVYSVYDDSIDPATVSEPENDTGQESGGQ